MKRCLSDKTLMRLQAGDGRAAQRAHVSTCRACADRYHRLGRELETVRHVLLHTDEPKPSAVVRQPSWIPVAAVAAALVVTLAVWSSVAMRRPSTPGPADRSFQDEETSGFLTEVSLTMFSIDGRAPASLPGVRAAGLSAGLLERGADCAWPDWPAAGCDETPRVDRLLTGFEPADNDL